jgi:hypothetical protein
MPHDEQKRAQLLREDAQLLRETFAIIEPKARYVVIHSQPEGDGCIVVRDVELYDELGNPLHSQGQEPWTELLLSENLGYILHCLYDAAACGEHLFNLVN